MFKIFTKLGGRKFTGFLLAFTLLAFALFFGKVSGGEFVSGLGIIFGVFGISNAWKGYSL